MLLSRRSLIIGLLATAGCGFTPVYGPGGSAPRKGLFALRGPQNVDGYHLLQQLELRLGAPSNPEYQLEFDITTSRGRVADDPTLRTQSDHLVGTANWTLRKSGATVGSGTARRFVSVAIGGGLIRDDARNDDAQARLAQALADEILRQVWAVL